jgi:hypothetical protein
MPKIFQIGFNRCGTTSLAKFFEANGLRSVHWKVPSGVYAGRNLALLGHENLWDQSKLMFDGVEDFDFYSDMEFVSSHLITNLYEKFDIIDKHYPGSRFILNIRDPEKWIASRLQHGSKPSKEYSPYIQRWLEYFGCNESRLRQIWLSHFHDHCKRVRDYFSDRPEQLLVFELGITEIDEIEAFLPEVNFSVRELGRHNEGAKSP